MAAIEANELVKKFGSVIAVNNISLKVEEGEIFGLVGLNGAGKTTTISILASLLNPDSGKATVYGYDVAKEKDAVRSHIGLVFEEQAVDVMLTGRQNLDFHARMYSLGKAERREKIAEVFKTVGLEEQADMKVKDYSGGMIRRLEIARAMLTYPKILFLDEPTIGLDVQTRRYLWDYIKKINKEKNTTIFLATSYLDEADYLCNRIVIIHQGKLVTSGAPEALKSSLGANLISLKLAKGSEEEFIKIIKASVWVLNIEKNIEGNVGSGENSFLNLTMKDASIGVQEIVRLAKKQGLIISSIKAHKPNLNDVLLHYIKDIKLEER